MNIELIAIGGSAGALDALLQILPALPATLTVPVALVMHLQPNHPSLLPSIFAAKCSRAVAEINDNDPLRASTLHIAPPNHHLQIERSGHFLLSSDAPVRHSRPSIDVFFESVADEYGDRAVGVLLSGTNSDGAEGLRKLRVEGSRTIVQSPDTALRDAMPRAALSICSRHLVLSPREIRDYLSRLMTPPAETGHA